MRDKLSIIVVEQDRERALMIVDSLMEAGDNDIQVISEVSSLARRISERNPDIEHLTIDLNFFRFQVQAANPPDEFSMDVNVHVISIAASIATDGETSVSRQFWYVVECVLP